ncbi:MAG: hypothetical protein LH603_18560 [Pseudonocardia sp.]|nr:hypothetical protein [Pseudonocardia sp.]
MAKALTSGAAPVRVVRHDHRGHGRSASVDPATMTIAHLADDLAAVLAAVAPPSIGLPGRPAAALRLAEQRIYASRRWADRTSLGDPRLLAPAIFPEAGHMLPVERVGGVAGRIGALVAGAPPPATG